MPPSKGLSSRSVFKFQSVKLFQINNSQFLNLRNTSILAYASNYDNEIISVPGDVFLTFSNITVVNNTLSIQDNTADIASLFSFRDNSQQVNLVSFIDSHFEDNQSIMSTMRISESVNININLTNNTFRNNFGLYGSAVLSILNKISKLNQLWATNNVFQNSQSIQKGGVFSITMGVQNVTLLNNIYINNSAQQGGVGYTSLANVMYYENNGTYIGNITSQFVLSLI